MPASACNTNYIVVRLHIYCIIAGMDIMGTSSGSLSPTTSGSIIPRMQWLQWEVIDIILALIEIALHLSKAHLPPTHLQALDSFN